MPAKAPALPALGRVVASSSAGEPCWVFREIPRTAGKCGKDPTRAAEERGPPLPVSNEDLQGKLRRISFVQSPSQCSVTAAHALRCQSMRLPIAVRSPDWRVTHAQRHSINLNRRRARSLV